MEALQAEYVASLFAPLHAELVAVLRGLAPDDWERRTVAPRWRVRDVAAHLLDGMLRKLSAHRDGHLPQTAPAIRGYDDVVELINNLNSTGVEYSNRLSPRLITDLLEVGGKWASSFVEALDPQAPALFPVAWANESQSLNWMDTGREYTEWWHHQAQIRDAVGSPLLLEPRWFDPLINFSIRALPRAYAAVDAPENTSVAVHVGSRVWSVMREAAKWQVYRGESGDASAVIRMNEDTAWRLFYNARVERDAIAVDGDVALAAPLLHARSVMV
jgi:uncharacterized protein (TIGR03083 family)